MYPELPPDVNGRRRPSLDCIIAENTIEEGTLGLRWTLVEVSLVGHQGLEPRTY